jgi:hypothetical protein
MPVCFEHIIHSRHANSGVPVGCVFWVPEDSCHLVEAKNRIERISEMVSTDTIPEERFVERVGRSQERLVARMFEDLACT